MRKPKASVEAAGIPLEESCEGEVVLPVIEEELQVGKRKVVTGKLRLTKSAREVEGTVDEPLVTERAEVERVPVGRIVDQPPASRQEGEYLVLPVVEEVLVKRYRVVEEIRIRKVREERRHQEKVVLRQEEVIIDRITGAESKPERKLR